MPFVCSRDDADISFTRSATFFTCTTTPENTPVISANTPFVLPTSVMPFSAFLTLSAINVVISFAAAELLCARLRTSSATTANPRPCSPARAASTAAFNANRFVWKAISSIILIIPAIFSLLTEISFIALLISFTVKLPFSTVPCPFSAAILHARANFAASAALSALRDVMEENSSIVAEVSSMDAACCVVASERLRLEEEICCDADATCVEPPVRSVSKPLKVSITFVATCMFEMVNITPSAMQKALIDAHIMMPVTAFEATFMETV